MFQINTTTKKFTEAASLNLGQLPVIDAKIDFRLKAGSEPVTAEGKTFEMTIGSVQGNLYKTDGDTVSFRYLKFDSTNVSATPAIVIKMEGVEILNDTISLTYQTSGEGGASGAAWGQITGSLQDQSDLSTALAGKISFPSGGSTGQFLQKTATGVQWAAVQGGGGSSTPDISSLKAVRTISSEDAFEALAQEVKDSLKEIAFLATPGTAEPLNWSAQDGYVRPGHAYLLLPFQWKYSYSVRWKHFVVTGRCWKCTLKGGSCKVDGVKKTLRPGEGTEQRTDTYGTSWDATKPAKTTILRLALDLNFLYISATKRIQLNANGTIDSDGNLIVLGEYQEKIDDGVWASNGQAVTELAYDYDIEYYTSGHWQDSTTVTVDIRDYFLFDLTASATYYAMPTSTKSAALEIAPGGRYAWTLDADSTLNAAAVTEGHWAAAQIDIAPGAHNVTAGSNLVIVDTLTANAMNICEARWRNGSARLKVVDVITGGGGGDTPQPTPTITAPSSQSVEGTQGEELAASITTGVSASNGASVSYSVKQGSALPAGLALSTAGDVTGTPTAAGSTTTTVVLSAEGCDSVEMSVSFAISEAAASDGFPKSFTVSSVSYQGQSITAPCGTYTKTGEAFPLTASSVAYPVYSHTGSDNKIYYICVVANMFGGDGPAWMLTATKPTASSVTSALAVNSYGGTTLKSGSYEPADAQWTGSDGNATVSWEM